MAADNSGNVYIAGHTASDLAGPYRGALDAWVAKFDAGGHLQWKRQLGTVLDDAARGVTSNANGNVIAGQRCSSV